MFGQVIEGLLMAIFAFTIFLACAGSWIWLRMPTHDAHALAWLRRDLLGLEIIAGSAPYIGLLGTVWHIIQALAGLGGGDLNVAAIARPIGEALYATMWGLASAIPALIVHTFLSARLEESEAQHD